MIKFFSKYIYNEDGATAIEYGMIAAAITLAIAGVVALIGVDIVAMFNSIEAVV